MRKTLVVLAAALSLSAGPLAAQDYPAYDINGVIQWAAGGAVDTVARAAAAIAEQELGRNIVMTNRTGGAGVIATRHVLAQPADGYTLLFGSTDAQLYKVLGLADVDLGDFYPVSLLVEEPNVIVVPAESPYQTFSDLMADVAARPGEVKMAHFGPGTSSHIISTMLDVLTEYDVNLVPFDGAGPAMTAALGGAVDVVNVGVSIGKPMIDSGRLRPLVIIAKDTNPQLANVPAVTDFLPDAERFLPWGPVYGAFAAKDIPGEAKERLSAAFSVAANDPDFRETMNERGVHILDLSGDPAAEYIARWQSISSWLLHEAGATKASPESFNIPRP